MFHHGHLKIEVLIFFLVCIDVYTRLLRVAPLKNKTVQSVTNAMKQMIEKDKPNTIESDQGSEFTSKEFKRLAKGTNISLSFVDTSSHRPLGVVDSVCRTIRGVIERYFTMYDARTYIDVLDNLVTNYNHTHHSGINSEPAKPDLDYIKSSFLEKYRNALREEVAFNIGDKVRYIINGKTFENGTQAKWSKTFCEVVKKN